jgi:hypothetical protein
VNHGARRQGIAARRRKKKTQGSSSITRKTLQTQIPCYAGIIMKCTRLRDFHGRLSMLALAFLAGLRARLKEAQIDAASGKANKRSLSAAA